VQVGEGSDEQFSGYSGYMKYLGHVPSLLDPFRKYLPKSHSMVSRRWPVRACPYANPVSPRMPMSSIVLPEIASTSGAARCVWDLLKSKLVR
jgi:asparagine synthase (glutamine-hydrolysing)